MNQKEKYAANHESANDSEVGENSEITNELFDAQASHFNEVGSIKRRNSFDSERGGQSPNDSKTDQIFEPKDNEEECPSDDYLPLIPTTTAASLSNQSCIITPSP